MKTVKDIIGNEDVLNFDFQQRIIKDIVEKINQEKQNIIIARLTAIGRQDIIIDKRYKRFKEIMTDVYPDREEVWFDDGTRNGMLLVPFYHQNKTFIPGYTTDGQLEVKFGFTYK